MHKDPSASTGATLRLPFATPPERIIDIEVTDNLRVRFRKKLPTALIEGACWDWQGAKTPRGQGVIKAVGGRAAPVVYAHRVAWVLHNGPIPPGTVVRQHCGNAACVNPAHLELDTCRVRQKAALRHPKHWVGAVSGGMAPLVLALLAKGHSHRTIAASLGIGKGSVANIVKWQREGRYPPVMDTGWLEPRRSMLDFVRCPPAA